MGKLSEPSAGQAVIFLGNVSLVCFHPSAQGGGEVDGRDVCMLRFHKHIDRFLSQIPGIFYTLLALQLH